MLACPKGMRISVVAGLCMLTALRSAGAQAVVSGQVIERVSGEPLSGASITVVSHGTQLLTRESGAFRLALPPGEVRLRFRRIGFAPRDTAFTVAASDTVRVRIEMARLAIRLPAVSVHGRCTDATPFEPRPAILDTLFDQVRQNAEALRLMAAERPFVLRVARNGGLRPKDTTVAPIYEDTLDMAPLPDVPYRPRRVVRPIVHRGKSALGISMPQLSDLADTAFLNNHCLWYAGQTRFEGDSVIQVDFEPVARLAKVADLAGSIYLRADGYQLVGMVSNLTNPSQASRGMREYFTRAVFREVGGVPVIVAWELTNLFTDPKRWPFSERSRVIDVRWKDPPR